MKKKICYLILIMLLITALSVTLISCIDDTPIPNGPMIGEDFRIADFETLGKVFPRTLLLPYEYGNEIIYVTNPKFPSGLEIKEKINSGEKAEELKDGRWEERYSGYTIKVNFNIEKDWTPNEEILNKCTEENINGYKTYIENDGQFIYFYDKNNEVVYSINIVPIKEMAKEQSIEKMREYIMLMMEEK